MKIFMLQTMWVSAIMDHEKRRYFKTKKAALKAEKVQQKNALYIDSRIVELRVEQ